ncbi:Vat family streptogramin A O-acetyltransferase [Bifidobacterium samirii]|uniref:Vat family streptogramin A O-acetyltransferase n=1 Tax=Bifidobacterium samirii TaxID=2306974 RepID=A0A430FUG1_9BIFI|nr:Vat family streptogramin A O-acetyltransferase [Bifidobacterium samirii]RSX56943.1 Vat family streptogramin A O-acetyltransferase [Bifidobacterium samirii]
MAGPDPRAVHPNPNIPSVCYINNTITRPTIIVGDYTYYDDPVDSEHFEDHVTHHYPFIGDRLVIGRFCAIAKGVEFIMNGANHRMNGLSTYPFNIMGGGWERCTPELDVMPIKGDTVIGNDVWIGQNVTILPGVHVGDGAIIGANSVVASDVPAYEVAVGDPCRVVRMRYDDATIARLEEIRWWDWPADRIFANLDTLAGGTPDDLDRLA